MKFQGGRRCRTIALLILIFFICGVVYIGYFCPQQVCALSSGTPTPKYQNSIEAYLHGDVLHQNFSEDHLIRDYDFDIDSDDVIVFLHIQKTGGSTFGRHLVKNIKLSQPCTCFHGRKRCDCLNSKRHVWLFSRYSTGWVCGVHADWTELKHCVNKVLDAREKFKRRRRYLYITILRDPVMRYLSEWRHVQRGATWLSARLRCNGRSATLEEVPFCFNGQNWSGVSLDEFMNCPHNLANNRLTRMLSNLSLVGCYNMSAMSPAERDRVLVTSAKENLKQLAFFGLSEEQLSTQYMFERTFKLHFIEDFTQRNVTHAQSTVLTSEQRQRVLDLNSLDIELYQYAKDLFFQRLKRMQSEDRQRSTTAPSRPQKPLGEQLQRQDDLPDEMGDGLLEKRPIRGRTRKRHRKNRTEQPVQKTAEFDWPA